MSFFVGVWLASVLMAVGTLLVVTRLRRFTEVGSELVIALLIFGFPLIYATPFSLWTKVLLTVVHLGLLALPFRLFVGRLEPPFLLGSTGKNAIIGYGAIVVLLALEYWFPRDLLEITGIVMLIGAVCIGLMFLGQLLWNMRHYRLPKKRIVLSEMPTVSVCIPARNEDHALADCLETVLTSDYPKIEVLVLDDCSQDKTSAIIRSFAHEGVRFVQGDQPALGWLGKTQAMQTLVSHASGDYILFMDVDTHISPQTITVLMQYASGNSLQMVSVAPQNRLALGASTLLGTLEQFWRIVLPIGKSRMPISSRLWLVKRSALDALGEFGSVSRKIIPEESFARRLFNSNEYRFLVGNSELGVTTAKRWTSHVATSLRLAYPLLRRQPFYAIGAVTALLAMVLGPLGFTVFSLLNGQTGVAFWLALTATALFFIDYLLVVVRITPKIWFLAWLLWPYVVFQEAVIYVASMVTYEFSEVNWKGRNVCYPVLTPQPLQGERPVWRRP
ncbi:MAG TPA: glycosyltransferase family 2 protein [Candidatus Saccharimonadales bacterium]|nr:glycosyltransferase family 2 protein [Candidatus Saccharimonadales bacterium]